MKKFKPMSGSGLISVATTTILYNIAVILIMFLVNSYEIMELLKICLIGLDIYFIYYILMYSTVSYSLDKENMYINSIFGLKKVVIPIKEIQYYKKQSGYIKSMRISGFSKYYYAIGRNIIDKLGNTYMYVTSNKSILYLKTEKINYGISPQDIEEFESILKQSRIEQGDWNFKLNKNTNIFKDKRYFTPFIIVTIMVLIITLTPIILYLYNLLPSKMPLVFDAKFNPVGFGEGKQFAFKQMMYGALNMVILFCMYYVSYFYSKYDKDYAYKFLYISLFFSTIFLIFQIRILHVFL
ncbi:PH domain-containing protein [Clostridium sp. Marseille-Q2269]|uniref:PH domain-containing protein n=1 Tax=Clostridium sp. Marseille-Q2269 TaxID=2942205 RepID=UPI002073C224|nr:PH domain-containing protein [Clostridium sp. Marseille-Q2269]